MSENHIDDTAELYALGMLDESERERVDAHVRDCVPCLERLGRAEATVAAMAEANIEKFAPVVDLAAHRRRSVPAWAGYAAAAVFAISTGVLAQQNHVLSGAVHSDGLMLGAMVRSHFAHAQFSSPSGTPLEAKVIYERHGQWYDIVALDAQPSWRLAVVRDGSTVVMPQSFTQRGNADVMTLRDMGRVRELQLRDANGTVIGRVRPAVAAEEAAGVGTNRGSGGVAEKT